MKHRKEKFAVWLYETHAPGTLFRVPFASGFPANHQHCGRALEPLWPARSYLL